MKRVFLFFWLITPSLSYILISDKAPAHNCVNGSFEGFVNETSLANCSKVCLGVHGTRFFHFRLNKCYCMYGLRHNCEVKDFSEVGQIYSNGINDCDKENALHTEACYCNYNILCKNKNYCNNGECTRLYRGKVPIIQETITEVTEEAVEGFNRL